MTKKIIKSNQTQEETPNLHILLLKLLCKIRDTRGTFLFYFWCIKIVQSEKVQQSFAWTMTTLLQICLNNSCTVFLRHQGLRTSLTSSILSILKLSDMLTLYWNDSYKLYNREINTAKMSKHSSAKKFSVKKCQLAKAKSYHYQISFGNSPFGKRASHVSLSLAISYRHGTMPRNEMVSQPAK